MPNPKALTREQVEAKEQPRWRSGLRTERLGFRFAVATHRGPGLRVPALNYPLIGKFGSPLRRRGGGGGDSAGRITAMQIAPPGASESQARERDDSARGRRVALPIVRSTRNAEGRGCLGGCIRNNTTGTIGNQIGRKRGKI